MSDKSKLTISSDPKKLKLASKLSELEIKEKERQTEEEAEEKGLPYINLHKFPISQQAIKIIPRDQAESLQTVCILYSGEELRLASLNPRNPQVSKLAKELGDKYHANIKVYLTSKYSFEQSLEIYKTIPIITQMEGVSLTEEDLNKFDEKLQDFKGLDKLIKETGLTESINLIMAAGLKFDASDIHIESEVDTVKVRLRIDGVLHETALLPKEAWAKISNRIKLLSGLKLNITDKPQDGRFAINLKEDAVDVRVSFIPSTYGESIVMRLLRSSSIGLEFEKLGLRGKSYNDLLNEFSKPNGMILTTGPTGSGKTTTLYSILNMLNTEGVNICTIEDPIEYGVHRINQTQINPKAGYTFATGLRALLRQDPDVIMIGEIRDNETAKIAVRAGLTGHLVLSTLHTNNAVGAPPRVLDMGVESFLLASTLNIVIAQRLVRKICLKCIESYHLSKEELVSLSKEFDLNDMLQRFKELKLIENEFKTFEELTFYRGKGCKYCNQSGYSKRISVLEILENTSAVQKCIIRNASSNDLQEQALKDGMITIFEDGLQKTLRGITTIEEVLRIRRE